MPQTSTPWQLNGDRLYQGWRKCLTPLHLWLVKQQLRHPLMDTDSRWSTELWAPEHPEALMAATDDFSSPLRKLTDMFLAALPWADFAKSLGSLRVCDIGCGKGQYAGVMTRCAGDVFDGYCGLDIAKGAAWDEMMAKDARVRFCQLDEHFSARDIPVETTLVTSITSMEHIPDDLTYFRIIRDWIESMSRPVTQVHLFPGSESHELYLVHGYRKYTPRLISAMTRLFSDSYRIRVVGFGGPATVAVHKRYFSQYGFREDISRDTYHADCMDAFYKDFENTDYVPAQYALIIERDGHTVFC